MGSLASSSSQESIGLGVGRVKLVNDFVVEGDRHSVHVLNAVSPAFTSSFAVGSGFFEIQSLISNRLGSLSAGKSKSMTTQ